MALIKYKGKRVHKKVCYARQRYIFNLKNDKTCEVENPRHVKLFLGENGNGQYEVVIERKLQPTELAVEEYRCKECKKVFGSYAGLKSHQSNSHKRIPGKSKAKPKRRSGK